jgi:DNA ligase-1
MKPFASETLDGELWSGYTQRTSDDEIPDAISLEFRVFDAPRFDGVYEARYAHLQTLFQNANVSEDSPLKLVPQIRVAHNEIQKIEDYFQEVLKKGGEGIVLRPSTLGYHWNTRCPEIMKKKPWDTLDVKIIGHYQSPDKEKIEGYVSSYICEFIDPYTNAASEFRVTCRTFSPFPIGSMLTIKYSQWTPDGLPKFPSILGNKAARTMTTDEKEKVKQSRFDDDGKKKKRKAGYNPKPSVIPTILKTVDEWKKCGGTELTPGQKVGVYGSKGEVWTVTCAARD